jgi:hypothetical protein
VLALVLVAGCELVFPLDGPDPIPPPDARVVDCTPGLPDEDGDGFPDDCDLCPHRAGGPEDHLALGIDSDTDTIGDRCDPDPGVAARRRWFHGMNDASGWAAMGWTFDGTAVPPAPATDLLAVETFASVHVEIWFEYYDTPAGAPVVFGVWARAAPSPRGVPDGIGCVLVRQPAGTTSLALVRSSAAPPGDTELLSAIGGFAVAPGVAYVMRLAVTGAGEIECALTDPGGTVDAVLPSADTTFPAGQIGVRADDVGAYVPYVFVVED